ncbi:MAG TPA: class I SAM-dependent methyltransferase [Gemmatimonadaceae bacterium]|nr:class I SAM-dependent methyltransferase [Gemmatimonadaceae bacterium]
MTAERESPDALNSNDDRIDPALALILDRHWRGEISAPVALMQLLIETEDASAVSRAVAAGARGQGNDGKRDTAELDRLIAANGAGCERIAAMLRADMDSAKPARTVEEGIAFCERLFDWSVQQSEEASVALYSLGNPELLGAATDEIVRQLHEWKAIMHHTALLDIGCGIGRMLTALAPHVRTATGIDVSLEMVKAAKRRCAGLANVRIVKGSGGGLEEFDDSAFDTAIAVDSFPYLRQSGYELVERFFAETARVLTPGGRLVILNYSYSGDDAADGEEVRILAAANGYQVEIAGERPFALWDGLAFSLIKSAA